MLRIGCHGLNAHQILHELKRSSRARLAAVSEIPEAMVKDIFGTEAASIKVCGSLDEMLDAGVDLVSLCSPRRRSQPEEAVRCLEAGKHVLAEKPSAFTMEELERILKAAEKAKVHFHEMCDSVLEPPLPQMKALIDAGAIGEPVQAWGQKSYPYRDNRPQDPDIDGGIFQAGLHALRFIEFLTGTRVKTVSAIKTRKSNPVKGGGLDMAAFVNLEMTCGLIASVTVNYLHRKELGPTWGNDQVRIFGSKGFIEATDGLVKGKIVSAEGSKELSEAGKHPAKSYFDCYLESLLDGKPMPVTRETELGFIEDTMKVMDSLRQAEALN